MVSAPTTVVRAHQRFLRALTPDMRRQVLALPDVLEAHRDYFVIFTARKSVCLADALRRLGFWQPRGDFSSNRALDGDLSALTGRDVLIVEDLAASCRTLLSTIEIAKKAGARDLKSFALSVEGPRNKLQKQLGAGFVSPYLESHIDQNLHHARSLVDAFAALPRPYNIDWPAHAYRESIRAERATERGWLLVDSAQTRSWALSVQPSDALMTNAAKVLPGWLISTFASSHLSKVRLYPVRDPHEAGTSTFAVPILALGGLRASEVSETLGRLSAMVGHHVPAFFSLREGYRILQFLLGDVLLYVFAASLGIRAPSADVSAAEFLFMPDTRDSVLAFQQAVRRWAHGLDWPPKPTVRPARIGQWDRLEEASVERLETEDFLKGLFVDSYVRSQEYQLRQGLRATPDTAERDKIMRKLVAVERASDGASFTAGELAERVGGDRDQVSGYEAVQLVSAFLDDANDAGEVVPDIDVVAGVGTRRFRPGEIINFERDTQAQMETMLRRYAERTGRDTFPVDLLQKLIVGYAGYLIAQRRLDDERPAGPSQQDVERLQLRYHLRGVVLEKVSPDFVAEQNEPEGARQLVLRGVLTKESKVGYRLAPERILDPPSEAKLSATIFGEVLADIMNLRNDRGGRQIDEDALTRLVTLTGPAEHVLALGADMIIAMRHVRDELPMRPGDPGHDAVMEAMHNGLAKASWIENDRSEALIRAIEKRLPDKGAIYNESASSVLRSLSPHDGDSHAKQVTRRLVQWFHDLYIWWSLCSSAALDSPETRKAGLASAFENRAFIGIGGLRSSTRGGRSRNRLRQHLSGEAVLDFEVLESLLPEVRGELLDGAQQLREECYELSSRSLAGTDRGESVESCLLVCANGCITDFGAVPGLQPALQLTDSVGEKLLGRFDTLVPVSRSFSLEAAGGKLLVMLQDGQLDAVLVHGMPGRFRPYRDTARQSVIVDYGFLDLAEIANTFPFSHGMLNVLIPARSASALSSTVRRDGTRRGVETLLSCEWECLSYAPTGQQLALASSTEPLQVPDPSSSGPTITIDTVYVQSEIHGSVQVNIEKVGVELGRLRDQLVALPDVSGSQVEALDKAIASAAANEPEGVKRWLRSAGDGVRDLLLDIGSDALTRLLLG
jgi:hypothetical protein